MNYLEVTVNTVSQSIETVAAALTAGGFDSLWWKIQAEFEHFLEDNRAYWDYIDESLSKELQGLSRIKLYLEMDGTEDAQLAELKALLERLRSASAKELGSLEVTAQMLPETNWEESWKDSYPPQEVGRSAGWCCPAGTQTRPGAGSP